MKKRLIILIGCLFLLPNCFLNADSVRILKEINGIPEEKSESGTIRQVSPEEIVLEQRDQNSLTIPIHQVLWAGFSEEPVNLTTARTQVLIGEFDSAINELNKISETELSSVSSLVQQEIDFYLAYSKAQKILQQDIENSSLIEAGKLLNAFLRNNPDSFHYYQANETVGTLLLFLKQPELAKSYFDKIARSPLLELSFPAKIQIANLLIDENKTDEARQLLEEILSFEEAITVDSESQPIENAQSLFQTLRSLAKIALARIEGLEGNSESGIKTLKELIETTDPKNYDLQAALFNAYGDLHQMSGNDQEAVLAYLRVDLLFFISKLEDRKALEQLYQLWKKQKKEDRASEVQLRLKEKFGINPE